MDGLGKETALWLSRMLCVGIQLFLLQFIYMHNYLIYNLLQINIGVFIARRLHPGTLCGWQRSDEQTQARSSRGFRACVVLQTDKHTVLQTDKHTVLQTDKQTDSEAVTKSIKALSRSESDGSCIFRWVVRKGLFV